jgi:hypothetical protein
MHQSSRQSSETARRVLGWPPSSAWKRNSGGVLQGVEETKRMRVIGEAMMNKEVTALLWTIL